MRRKLIIDTDCGGDDAIAIMAALTHPDVDVVAITAVWGNVDVDQAVENAGKLLDFFDRDVPIYRGAAEPMLGHRETVQWGGYGSDGFGDAGFPRSARTATVPRKHAAVALVDIVSAIDAVAEADSAVWQLVCLGPLTNVAIALKLDPNLMANLGGRGMPGLVIMGGTTEAKGNSGLASEFNIHCDPEAARIVFMNRIARTPFYLVTWELTVGCAMTWDFFDSWIGRQRGPDGKKQSSPTQNRVQVLIEKLFGQLEVFTRPQDDGAGPDTGDAEVTQDVTCVIPDAVAMVALLYPAFVTDSIETFCTIELHGRETRGATVIDWYGTDASLTKKGRWRNCRVITKVDTAKFLDGMTRIVTGHPAVPRPPPTASKK